MIFLCSFIFVYSHFKNNITATIQICIFFKFSVFSAIELPPYDHILRLHLHHPPPVLLDHDHDNVDLNTVGSPVLFSHNQLPDRTVWRERSTRQEDDEQEKAGAVKMVMVMVMVMMKIMMILETAD